MVDSIGRMSFGRTIETGKSMRNIIEKVKTKMQLWRDAARLKLFTQRRQIKMNVQRNEAKMRDRKEGQARNLNPTAFSTMPSHEYAKSLRNPANLSMVPPRTKYSDIKPRIRIYGKRFDKIESGEIFGPRVIEPVKEELEVEKKPVESPKLRRGRPKKERAKEVI